MFGSSADKKKQLFARIGLGAKGLVYCLISVLVFMSALGISRQRKNKEEALKLVGDQPFGQVLLVVIGISVIGYVFLRCIQAFKGKDDNDKGWKSGFRRVGYVISAFIYTGVSYLSFRMALGDPDSSGNPRETYLTRIINVDGGKLAVMAAGIIIIGQGVYQCYRGFSGKFMKRVHLYQSDFKKTYKAVGTLGYIARGVVLTLVGYLFLRAGFDRNPKEAKGTDGAFAFLQSAFGNWMLAVIAIGTLAYGIFMFVRAKREKLNL